MGAISVERLLPKHILHSDDASPIAGMGLPKAGALTRIGFHQNPNEPLLFEGETQMEIRLQQRTWHYRLKKQGKGKDAEGKEEPPKKYESNRLRLEIVVKAKNRGALLPGHQVVVVQRPYANGWVQVIPLKNYSKRKEVRQQLRENPPVFDDLKDVEKQLENAYSIDLWETGSNYVAAISFANGYQDLLGHPRNSPTDYVCGVCPDFKELEEKLLNSKDIQRLKRLTERGAIAFWKLDPAEPKPRLHVDTKAEAWPLLVLSVRQALAGPDKYTKQWHGQPVWKLVEYLYCGHLNNLNRANCGRKEYQFNKRTQRLIE